MTAPRSASPLDRSGSPQTPADLERRLRQAEDNYWTLVESSPLGIAILQDHRLAFANRALRELTGYPVDEIRSRTLQTILTQTHPDYRTVDRLAIEGRLEKHFRGAGGSPLDAHFYTRTGKPRWVKVWAARIFYEGKPAVQVTVLDFTHQKTAETEALRVREELEFRVIDRTQMLSQANKALMDQILERERFEEALRNSRAELEKRVEERTTELAQLNQALEAEISERKLAEDALRLSEALFRSLSEKASDMVTIVDADGVLRYASPSIETILGYPTEVLIGRKVSDFIHPDDQKNVAEIFERTSQAPDTFHPVEFRFHHVDGSWRSLESTWINMLHVPIINGMVVNSRDITKRKEMIEEKARLYEKIQHQHEQLRALAIRRRQLAHEVITAQEKERHRVSRELHDEAGQALTVLKLSLEELLTHLSSPNGHAPDMGELSVKLRQAVGLCETTMEQIRHIAHGLRPAGLDDLGLNLTLQGYCQDFSERAHLPITYSGAEPPELSADSVICLYRFLQEGLTNVAKHASARNIQVSLRHNDNEVRLQIEDDGSGFDLHANGSPPHNQVKGIGLLGLQERLASLGGSMTLSTAPGSGTRLIAVLPLGEGT